ncbi:hypothetical protein P3W24_04020 [Luteibacter sp. PPL201]|uniref:Phage tail protein n=1 Tax=Luteibacter sahnii TaxID=3021977 RepID=A0ABT6B7W2_9GAMM
MATIPSWPATLPAPAIDGYSVKPKPTFVRTDMDSGRARNRRRFVTGATEFQQRFRMTQSQLAIFEAWFENEAFGGAADAMMPLITGQGKVMVQCEFTDTYQRTAVPGSKLHDVTLSLSTYSKLVPNG